MGISKIGVVGAGAMGSGIAQVLAQVGCQVTMVDVKPEFIDRGLKKIKSGLERMVKKGILDQAQAEAAFSHIKGTTSLAEFGGMDFIVEAVLEDKKLKQNIFRELDTLCQPEVVLASNTSSLSIAELAAVTQRPDKIVGMHFMNPVPVMKLVEVVRGAETSQTTVDTVKELCTRLGKTPVEVNDFPGFVSNRILLPMINEAVYALMQGVATKEAIDEVMKSGMNHPIGPLALADLIGLDVCLAILNVLAEGFKDQKYRPCPLLKKMVAAGHLGRKTGRGFYEYA